MCFEQTSGKREGGGYRRVSCLLLSRGLGAVLGGKINRLREIDNTRKKVEANKYEWGRKEREGYRKKSISLKEGEGYSGKHDDRVCKKEVKGNEGVKG